VLLISDSYLDNKNEVLQIRRSRWSGIREMWHYNL